MTKRAISTALILVASGVVAVVMIDSERQHADSLEKPKRAVPTDHARSIGNGDQNDIEQLAALTPSGGNDSRLAATSPEIDLPSETVATAVEPLDKPDRSGLTEKEKLHALLKSHERFQNSAGARDVSAASDESFFVTCCAVNILRASGRAVYDPDIVTDGKPAFRNERPSSDVQFTLSSNAKYAIDLNEFPAVRIARDRYRAVKRGGVETLPKLTATQLQQYEALMDQALARFRHQAKIERGIGGWTLLTGASLGEAM